MKPTFEQYLQGIGLDQLTPDEINAYRNWDYWTKQNAWVRANPEEAARVGITIDERYDDPKNKPNFVKSNPDPIDVETDDEKLARFIKEGYIYSFPTPYGVVKRPSTPVLSGQVAGQQTPGQNLSAQFAEVNRKLDEIAAMIKAALFD